MRRHAAATKLIVALSSTLLGLFFLAISSTGFDLSNPNISFDQLHGKRILVVGGSGRKLLSVGSSGRTLHHAIA